MQFNNNRISALLSPREGYPPVPVVFLLHETSFKETFQSAAMEKYNSRLHPVRIFEAADWVSIVVPLDKTIAD